MVDENLLMNKDVSQNEKDKAVFLALSEALKAMHLARPEGRSEMARRYAVSITDFEKVTSYFWHYVLGGEHYV